MYQSSIRIVIFFATCFLTVSCNSKPEKETVKTKLDPASYRSSVPPKTDNNINKKTKSVTDCIDDSDFELPYNKTIDPEKASYKTLNCKIIGIEEYNCPDEKQRYFPLPDLKKVKVILVPMDCGDFKYRYILLTILENKIVSNKYVEGEWYEPENDDYKEITSFSINVDYVITITTKTVENGKTSIKETTKIQVRDDGTFSNVN
jgi:hypothetical protein